MSGTYRPSLFYLALATTVIALVLIASGGTVTSTGVGMVDEGWTFSPFQLFTVRGLENSLVSAGMFIEHSHRQVGYIVGMLALALAILGYVLERRWLGLLVLAAVSLQGGLGAARILFNPEKGLLNPNLGRDYAMIHGFVGQLTFAFLAACTLAFSRSWVQRPAVAIGQVSGFQSLCRWVTGLFVLQLALAVLVRHVGGDHLVWTHALVAALILGAVLILLFRSARIPSRLIQMPVWVLTLLVKAMIILGLAAWWQGAGGGALDTTVTSLHRIVLATAHQTLGALTLAASVIVTMRAGRHCEPAGRAEARG